MPRARYIVAASLVFLIAGSVARWNGPWPRSASQQVELTTARPGRTVTPATPTAVPPSSGLLPSPPVGLGYAPRSNHDFRRAQYRISQGRGDQIEASARPRALESMPPAEPVGRDKFANAPENAFKVARDAPVSTFSIDVDTASYSFVRAQLNRNVLPPAASVRTEELINYFPYAYEAPASASEPFRANVAVFPNPWAEGRKLIRIGVKGYALQQTTGRAPTSFS